uniref:heptahelical transmembrane protein 1-like isoform X2 n=1 Tax=Erigeron canadensis TaxID=72917 RepID=UPI001CB8BAA7|nr:heptahelical transmembrane protein 1-like isoform X2 [Erigeron canadensis]
MKENAGVVRMRKSRAIGDQDSQKRSNLCEKKTQNVNKPLCKYEELPEYMKDNEFILNYYRAEWSPKQAFFSLFHWHNETLNVWTHLIGFVVFVGLTISNMMHVPQVSDFLNILTWSFPLNPAANALNNSMMETPRLIDLKHGTPLDIDIAPPLIAATRWPFFVFLSGAMFCLLSSSTCHLFGCHSHRLNLQLLQLDYVGITVMIITSFFPPIYYIFQCDPIWQFIYLGGITVMGIFTIITLLSPALSSGKFRSFRAFLFVSMGLFGLIPSIHACILNWDEPQRNATLVYESAMALSYLIGTLFYVTRIPERWKPGWFDLAGHSHQIFHCFVIMGALSHYAAAVVFLESWGQAACQ